MKKSKLPKTDSIRKLAAFWNTHNLTDFADDLEEIDEPVFVRGGAIEIPLDLRKIKAVERIAKTKGLSSQELVRPWILQKLARGNNIRPAKR